MSKEGWVGPAYPVEPVSRALGLVTHPLELAARPADARVVHLGQFGQGRVAAMMKRPAPNCSADGRQRLRTGSGQEARKGPTSPSQRFPRSERKPEKVERLVRKVPPAVRILAIDDLRLLRVQHQLAGREAIL